jgi:transposase
MHIRKEGDPYVRILLVQGAQHILEPFGVDCDLRRWGLKLASGEERVGRNERLLPQPESSPCCCITCG